jgi:hypothetical protein
MGATTLEQLGLGLAPPVTIADDQLVAHCVTELDAYQVSALPIVDANTGKLVGNFSVSDLIVSTILLLLLLLLLLFIDVDLGIHRMWMYVFRTFGLIRKDRRVCCR